MPRLITGENLIAAVRNGSFIKGGDERCVEGTKYDFRLSNDVLKAGYDSPINMGALSETERMRIVVEPGEMVFGLTEESLELPQDMIAFLSPKRRMSHLGVLVIGGLAIDPSYKGKLLVGIYNFSSTRFPLLPGRKLIAATFYMLEGNERGEFPPPCPPLYKFDDELVRMMNSYKPVSLANIEKELRGARQEIESLRAEIRSQETWQREFRTALTEHGNQIGKLLEGLKEEKENRSGEDKVLREHVDQLRVEITRIGLKVGLIVGILAAGGALVGEKLLSIFR